MTVHTVKFAEVESKGPCLVTICLAYSLNYSFETDFKLYSISVLSVCPCKCTLTFFCTF